MELTSAFTMLRRYARHLILAAIVGGVVGYTVSNALPKQFESEATVLVGQALTSANPDLNGLDASLRLSQTYAQLATTRPRLDAVIATLKLDTTADELVKRLTVQPSSQGPLIHIAARAATPEEAAAIANALAAQLIDASPTVTGQTRIDEFLATQLAETQRQIIALQQQLDEALTASPSAPATGGRISALQGQLTTIRATYAGLLAYTTSAASNSLTIAEPAIPNPDPAAPRPVLNALLAAVLAVILTIGLVVAREQLDDSFKTTTDVEDGLGLPVLGTIPLIPGRHRQPFYALDTVLFPRSGAAESFRAIRTNLDAAGPEGPLRSILVTSSLGGEGKTKVAANLAIAFAQTGRKVILLDADLRRSRIHEMFRLENERGLSNLMRNPGLGPADVTQTTEVPNLRIITAGQIPPDPAEMLGSAGMRSLLAALGGDADILIIDSSPAIPVTDPAVLSSVVDGVILVVRSGVTRRANARASQAALTRVGGRVIGVVLNGITAADGQIYGAYGGPVVASPAPSSRRDEAARSESGMAEPLFRPAPSASPPDAPGTPPDAPATPEVATAAFHPSPLDLPEQGRSGDAMFDRKADVRQSLKPTASAGPESGR